MTTDDLAAKRDRDLALGQGVEKFVQHVLKHAVMLTGPEPPADADGEQPVWFAESFRLGAPGGPLNEGWTSLIILTPRHMYAHIGGGALTTCVLGIPHRFALLTDHHYFVDTEGLAPDGMTSAWWAAQTHDALCEAGYASRQPDKRGGPRPACDFGLRADGLECAELATMLEVPCRVEVKADILSGFLHTFDMAIEVECDGKPSGLARTEAHWWAHVPMGPGYTRHESPFFLPELILLFEVPMLTSIVDRVSTLPKRVKQGGDLDLSTLVLLKWADIAAVIMP